MAGGIFNKLLDMVGLEETDWEEEEAMDEENLYEDEAAAEPEEQHFGRGRRKSKVVNFANSGTTMRMVVYQPSSYEDTQNIIDNIKARKPVIINLDELDVEIAQRILDFVSGAIYALNGSIKKVARAIFVVAPMNVDITANIHEESEEQNYYGGLNPQGM